MKYVAIVVKAGNGYWAYLPDLPGCIAAGETSRLIQEAAVFHLEGMAEDEEAIPKPSSVAIEVVGGSTLLPYNEENDRR